MVFEYKAMFRSAELLNTGNYIFTFLHKRSCLYDSFVHTEPQKKLYFIEVNGNCLLLNTCLSSHTEKKHNLYCDHCVWSVLS